MSLKIAPLYLIFAFSAVMASSASAQLNFTLQDYKKIDVPCVKPPKPRIGKSRVRLARFRPFLYQLGPNVYAVPYAYLRGVGRDVPSCRRDSAAIPFQFWIPDGLPPEKVAVRNYIERPTEMKRPNPSPREWVVTSVGLKYFYDKPSVNEDADKIFSNIKSLSDNAVYYEANLDLFALDAGDSKTIKRYYNSFDKYSFYAWCSGIGDRVSTCKAVFTFHKLNLAGEFYFSYQALRYYKIIADVVQMLINRWAVK